MKSYYEILGVSENASQDEIKQKYRSHALKMHPDRISDDLPRKEAEEIQRKFQEITNAYQTLSDEKERKKYDAQRSASRPFGFDSSYGSNNYYSGSSGFSGMDFDFEDIFESFFGGRGKSSRSWSSHGSNNSSSGKAEDLEVILTISFKDLVVGSTKKFNLDLLRSCSLCSQTGAFSKDNIKTCGQCEGKGFTESIKRTFLGSMKTQSECSNCNGLGKIVNKKCTNCKGSKLVKSRELFEIKVPRGIKPGQKMTVKSRGNDQIGGARGDVVIEIALKKDDFFEKKDNEIHCQVPVSFLDAILGNKIKIPTIEGIQEVNVPKYSQFGDFIVLKSKGFYTSINGDRRGDFYAWLQIKLPKRISSETEYLIKKFYDVSLWNPNEEFIKKMKE